MTNSKALLSTLAISATVACVGVLARKSAEKGWQNMFDENPPPKDEEHDLDFKDAALWAFVTGFSTALLRMGAKRYLRAKQKKVLQKAA